MLFLLACADPEPASDKPVGDDTAEEASDFALTTPEDVRELLVVATTFPSSGANIPVSYVSFALQGQRCPPVEDLGDGRWRIGGEPCTQAGSGARTDGSIEIDGLAFVDASTVVPGTSHAVWDAFSVEMDVPDLGTMSETIDGEQVFSYDEEGPIDGAFDVQIAEFGFTAEWVSGVAERNWRLDGWSSSNLWARYVGGDDEVDGAIEIVGVGTAHVSGTFGWDPACPLEPAHGTVTLTAANTVTLVFDGAASCDGFTPIEGIDGRVDWPYDDTLGGEG